MKKILICCFVLLLLHNSAQGQVNYKDPAVLGAFLKEKAEEVKNNAEFVFEGFFQRRDTYPRKDKNGKVYYPTSEIVKITKVFRGNLKPGTVELAGIVDLSEITVPSERASSIHSDSTKYIFFCRAAGKDHPYDATYDIYPVDNKTILMRNNEYVINIFRIPGDHMFETKMYSEGDFYRYISKLPNVKMPVITREDTVEVSRHKVIPGKPQGLTKIEKDSLKAIRIAKRIHRADSIGRVRVDSIALVKKKVKPLTSLKATVATEGVRKLSIEDDGSDDNVTISYDGDDDFTGEIDLGPGDTEQLGDNEQIDDDEVIYESFWQSSNPLVASIDPTGKITAVSDGKVTIYRGIIISYPDPGCDPDDGDCEFLQKTILATCTVVVSFIQVTSVTLPETVSIADGNESQLTATIEPYNAGNQKIRWTSSAEDIASVDDNGLVTANSPGEATITAYATDGSGESDDCIVTVTSVPVTGVTVTPATRSMDAGEVDELEDPDLLTATIAPSNATDQDVTWTSSDESTAIVDKTGLVTAVSPGKATITATTDDGGFTASCVITVVPRIDSIDNESYSAGDGNTITIHGQGFGDTQGSSCVVFASSDDGDLVSNGTPPMRLPDQDVYDYTSTTTTTCTWSDQQITMLLPGKVYNSITSRPNDVGDGDVQVQISPAIISDPTNLHIVHNYVQHLYGKDPATFIKYKVKPANTVTGNPGITFKLDPTLTPQEIGSIKLAMANWSCSLPLNISVDPSSINTIQFGPLDAGTLMHTETTFPTIIDTNTQGADISPTKITITLNDLTSTHLINNTINWDTTLPTDLSTALSVSSLTWNVYYGMLHELGHVLGLGHVNMQGELMYFKENNQAVLDASNALPDAKTRVKYSELTLKWLTAPSTDPVCPIVVPTITSFTGALNADKTGVVLNWGDVDPTATYTIERGTFWNTPSSITSSSVLSSTYTDSYSFTPDTYYTYYLTASNDYSTASANTSVSTGVQTTTSTPSPGQVDLTYAAVPNATGYTLLYSTSPNGPFTADTHATQTVNSDGTITFTDKNATQGQPYYYEMQATNASGGTLTTPAVAVTGCIGASLLANPSTISSVNYPSGTSLVTGSTITTSGTDVVSSGATLNIEAANSIQFSPGFSAKAGSTMDARIITACGGSATKSPKELGGIEPLTPVTPANETTSINIYPNPNKGSFIVSLNNEAVSVVSVMSISGQSVEYNTIYNNTSNSLAITFSNVAKGMYIVKLKGKQKMYVQKVVVE